MEIKIIINSRDKTLDCCNCRKDGLIIARINSPKIRSYANILIERSDLQRSVNYTEK